jgi:AcrR family transcriptional regulator
MGTSERKQRERELRKRSILNAAHRIFLEKGFESTTMDDIAEAVELSKGAVYFYFKSKSELCLSILLESLKVISASFEQISGEAVKGIDKLKLIFKVHYDFQEENPQFINAIINFRRHRADCDHENEILQATLQENDKINIILKNCIVCGKADGSIDNTLDEKMLANSLWGQINGILPNMILANKEHNEIYHSPKDLYKFSNSLIIKAIQM